MINNVAAILVTYNPDVYELQESLLSISKQIDRIIIVDNASQNIVLLSKMISCHFFDKVDMVSSPVNIGLSAAQNLGIKKARDCNVQHIVLFDQDSKIDDGFIFNMLETERVLLSKGEPVAAIGPSFFDAASLKPYPATVYRGPFIKRIDVNDITEATFIIASGCLIRMEVLDRVGMMKEDLFIDYIDIEWSLRAKSLGYKVFISPQAKMAHSIGDRRMSIMGRSVSVHSPIRRYYLTRNSFYLMRLSYVPVGYKLREAIFNVLRIAVSIVTSKERSQYIKYGLLGIRDGLKGKFGPLQKY